jgi:sodium/bile acid cotransporter 7
VNRKQNQTQKPKTQKQKTKKMEEDPKEIVRVGQEGEEANTTSRTYTRQQEQPTLQQCPPNFTSKSRDEMEEEEYVAEVLCSSTSSPLSSSINPQETPPVGGDWWQIGSEQKNKRKKEVAVLMEEVRETVLRNWFVIGIGMVVFLAWAVPSLGSTGGILHPEVTSKLVLGFVFLASGLTLPTSRLRAAVKRGRLHCYVQLFNLFLIPAAVFLLSLLLRLPIFRFEALLLEGLIVLACLPTTVGTSVLFTKSAKGNEAAAIFNSTVGNLLGMLVSPVMILILTGREKPDKTLLLPLLNIFKELCLVVILPMIAGQLLRLLLPLGFVTQPPWATISSCGILFIVFTVFCNTFSLAIPTDLGSLFSIALLVISSHLLFLSVCWVLSGWCSQRPLSLGFSIPDRVAILFCSTQKTMALGVELIHLVYSNSVEADNKDDNNNDALGLVLLPLLIYHPTQLLMSSLLTPTLASLVTAAAPLLPPPPIPPQPDEQQVE